MATKKTATKSRYEVFGSDGYVMSYDTLGEARDRAGKVDGGYVLDTETGEEVDG